MTIRLLLFVILAYIVARLLWRLLTGVFEGMGYQPPGGGRKSVGLVRDPVCGTFVVPSRALTSGSGSSTRYFCSEKCRQDWAQKNHEEPRKKHRRNTEETRKNTEEHGRNTGG